MKADCPAPSPEEMADAADWIVEDPPRPAQDWVARIIGKMFPDELKEVRGEPDSR